MEFDNKNLSVKLGKIKINKNKNLSLNDAELLAYMARDIAHTYATNGHCYWYYVFEDIKECDFITYLFNRNGLYAKLHYSHYLDNYKLTPVLRIRSRYVKNNPNAKIFVSLIKANRTILKHEKGKIRKNMIRAINDFSKYSR